jgi:iron complex outermembrane receptor protein
MISRLFDPVAPLLAGALLAVAAPAAAGAQAPDRTESLLSLSLEQLMNIEVTSVGKKSQPLSSAAAAIYVITQEDIRRSGASTIPELLRMVPGLDVAQSDSRHWAVSARGFNSVYAAKLLVLVDGRSVYSPVFSGVLWDQLDVPLQDIERIEVIRGPGGTIWGANAVNGVINIITKKTKDTQGPSITAGTGSDVQADGTLQYGGRIGEAADYRLYAKGFDRPGFVSPTGADLGDSWRGGSVGGRLDWTASPRDSLSFSGQYYRQRMENPLELPSLVGPPVETRLVQHNAGGHALVEWSHRFSEASQTTLQAFFNRVDYQDAASGEATDTWDVEFRHHLLAGARHDLVWGGGYRRVFNEAAASPYLTMTPIRGSEAIFNGFVQDEFALTPSLHLIGGVKLEHNTFTGWENEPSLRVAWEPARSQTLWASVSRAVRVPSFADENIRLFVLGIPADAPQGSSPFPLPFPAPVAINVLGNPGGQKSEELVAWEAGYRGALSQGLTVDLTAFYNSYSRLTGVGLDPPFFTADPPPPHLELDLRYGNQLKGHTYGAELSANWRPRPWWRLSGSYSVMQYKITVADPSAFVTDDPSIRPILLAGTVGVSPHYQAQLRSYMDLPGRTELDAAIYRVGALAGADVPAYTRLDVRLGWRATDHVSFSLAGRNLLQARHPEFSPIVYSPAAEVPRSVYFTVTLGY